MKYKKRILLNLFLVMVMFGMSHAQSTPAGVPPPCLMGQPGAPIRIDLFSDYQCPSCRIFYLETIIPLAKEYSRDQKICINYFDLPLKRHAFAFEASRYGVASRQLGQDQWQRVSAALYERQADWSEDGKIEAVVSSVLGEKEMARLKKFLKDPSIDQTINKEMALANERKVGMTPTFFLSVNGREKKVNGKVSYPILKDYIERMMK
jgi:protein-disulfide isomerase